MYVHASLRATKPATTTVDPTRFSDGHFQYSLFDYGAVDQYAL
jgi:hypothetical protein